MDAAALRVFEAVARLGGIGRAAAALNTVQSNVTARIRQLEEDLGATLFHRHSRGVALTPAGERLLPYAAKVGSLLAEARRAVVEDGTPSGPLVIGSLETVAALHLAGRLADFARLYPAVDLNLRTGTTCELMEEVLLYRLEGAFVAGPVAHPDLLSETVFREELVLVTAPHIRSVEAACALRIVVLRAGCSYRQRLEQVMAVRGQVTPRMLEFGTLEAIMGSVSAGLGATLLPRAFVARFAAVYPVAVHTLSPEEARTETLFIRRRDTTPSAGLRCFLASVQPVVQAAA
jgi:LysR family transcriptional regulator, cell division regulator